MSSDTSIGKVLDVDPASEVRTATVTGIGGRWAADTTDGEATDLLTSLGGDAC